MPSNKISIEELEQILSSEKEYDIQIEPNGSIVAVDKGTAKNACFNPLPTIDYY